MIMGLNRILKEQAEQNSQMGIGPEVYQEDQDDEQAELLRMIFQYMKEKNKEIIKRFDEIKSLQEEFSLELEEIKKKLG